MNRKMMMIAVLSFLPVLSAAQQTKKITIEHKKTGHSEVFYVLETDENIKHGVYQELGYKGDLLTNGYYDFDKRDSTWTTFFPGKKVVESVGNYADGKKIGIWTEYHLTGSKSSLKSRGEYGENGRIGVWEFYDAKAKVIQKYDFDRKKLLYTKPDEGEYEVIVAGKTIRTKLDHPAVYIGGETELMTAFRRSKLIYPIEAKERGISGIVLVSFLVDASGVAYDHRIEQGIGGGCDEESLRAVKEIANDWVPASLDGNYVISKFIFPVTFTLK